MKRHFQRNSKIALEREVRAKKDELAAVQDKIRQEERKAIETQRLIDGRIYKRMSVVIIDIHYFRVESVYPTGEGARERRAAKSRVR